MIIYQTCISFSPVIESIGWVYQRRCNRALLMSYLIIRARRLGMQVDFLREEEADSTKALKADSPILNDYF